MKVHEEAFNQLSHFLMKKLDLKMRKQKKDKIIELILAVPQLINEPSATELMWAVKMEPRLFMS